MLGTKTQQVTRRGHEADQPGAEDPVRVGDGNRTHNVVRLLSKVVMQAFVIP